MKKECQVKMKYTNCSLTSTNAPLEAVNYDSGPENHVHIHPWPIAQELLRFQSS